LVLIIDAQYSFQIFQMQDNLIQVFDATKPNSGTSANT